MSASVVFRGAAGAFVLFASVGSAQRVQGSVDVGAMSLRYADTLNATALTLSPDVRVDWERAIAQVAGTFSQFAEGAWSAQASASGSLFTAARRGLLGELAATAGGSTHQDGTRTGQAIANLRLHQMGASSGVFGGAGGGGTWDGALWRRLLLGELGGWIQNHKGGALLTITPVAVDDSVRYLDGQLTLTRSFNKVDVSALAGGRGGGQNPGVETGSRAWGSVTAVAWLRPRIALTGRAGTYPVDLTQGFPGGRFLSVSVRVATSQRRAELPRPDSVTLDDPGAPATGLVQGFQAERLASGAVLVRVNARAAQRVEVTGDFTGWAPVLLQPTGEGWWSAEFQLAPGHYEMNVRVDGGTWVIPPGLLPLKDEYGGTAGLLVIP